MRCDRCGREAVHFQRYSGLRLCGEHLAASLESRAKRMIRARAWIRPGDRIAIGFTGSLPSSSLLHFLPAQFGMRRDISLVAITVDEGGRDMSRVKAMAEGMGVGWAGSAPGDLCGDLPPSSPGLRDRALASLAGRVGATKLALGTTLDDEAEAVFLRVIRGEAARLAGPPAGVGEGILHLRGPCPSRGAPAHPWTAPPPSEPGLPAGPGIPVIRPFSRIPEEELILYARLQGITPIREEAVGVPGDIGDETGRMLAEYTRRHPSALFTVANIGEALAGYGRSGRGGPLRSAGWNREQGHEGFPGTGVPRPGDGP